MTYTKPEIVHCASALETIQGTGSKKGRIAEGDQVTTPAYEADE